MADVPGRLDKDRLAALRRLALCHRKQAARCENRVEQLSGALLHGRGNFFYVNSGGLRAGKGRRPCGKLRACPCTTSGGSSRRLAIWLRPRQSPPPGASKARTGWTEPEQDPRKL